MVFMEINTVLETKMVNLITTLDLKTHVQITLNIVFSVTISTCLVQYYLYTAHLISPTCQVFEFGFDILLICLNVLLIFITWNLSCDSKLFIDGMCVVALALATKTMSGTTFPSFVVILLMSS